MVLHMLGSIADSMTNSYHIFRAFGECIIGHDHAQESWLWAACRAASGVNRDRLLAGVDLTGHMEACRAIQEPDLPHFLGAARSLSWQRPVVTVSSLGPTAYRNVQGGATLRTPCEGKCHSLSARGDDLVRQPDELILGTVVPQEGPVRRVRHWRDLDEVVVANVD